VRDGNAKPGDPEAAPAPEDEELLAAVAGRVARHRMELPAVLFLESVRPLNFVGSQALVFLQPLLTALFDWSQYERFVALAAERQNLDRLTCLIERAAEARDDAERAARDDAKAGRPAGGA
jgi:hypothetical protein